MYVTFPSFKKLFVCLVLSTLTAQKLENYSSLHHFNKPGSNSYLSRCGMSHHHYVTVTLDVTNCVLNTLPLQQTALTRTQRDNCPSCKCVCVCWVTNCTHYTVYIIARYHHDMSQYLVVSSNLSLDS